eukprot:GSA120T00001739001.1
MSQMFEEGSRFWLPDAKHGYVAAQLFLRCEQTKTSTFRVIPMSTSTTNKEPFDELTCNIEQRKLPLAEADKLAPVNDEQLLGLPNICNLTAISEAALLATVRARFERKEIYTNVARIVLAVNPFEELQIYTPEFVDVYSQEANHPQPHVFGIGADAFHGLMTERTPQSVLISGESGAGKTESTKHVLSFLADVAGNTELGIENKILSTNPILEAFGNAKTIRNNNSSRFGKWIKVMFLKKMEIEGAEITDYLLETTRVVTQAPEERNYHIFYQLLSCGGAPKMNAKPGATTSTVPAADLLASVFG